LQFDPVRFSIDVYVSEPEPPVACDAVNVRSTVTAALARPKRAVSRPAPPISLFLPGTEVRTLSSALPVVASIAPDPDRPKFSTFAPAGVRHVAHEGGVFPILGRLVLVDQGQFGLLVRVALSASPFDLRFACILDVDPARSAYHDNASLLAPTHQAQRVFAPRPALPYVSPPIKIPLPTRQLHDPRALPQLDQVRLLQSFQHSHLPIVAEGYIAPNELRPRVRQQTLQQSHQPGSAVRRRVSLAGFELRVGYPSAGC